MPSSFPLRLLARCVLLFHFVAALALGVQAYREPVGNWDIIPYVALVRAASGASGAALSQQTYDDVRQYLGQEKFQLLLGRNVGPDETYRAAVYESPQALAENLRFYSVKPLYILLSRAVTAAAGNAAQAGVLVSAAAFTLFMMVFPLFFRRPAAVVAAVAGTWLLVATGVPPIMMIAGCATPDSLGLLFAGTAALLAAARAAPAWVGVAGLLAVLSRPDAMFLLGPLLLGLAWLERRDPRGARYLVVLVLLSATFLYLGTQALSWSTLFRHTFFGRIPYPEAGVPAVTPAEYWSVVSRTFPVAANLRVAIMVLLGCTVAIVSWLRTRAVNAVQLLAASALVNVVAHFLIFPIDEFGHERLFLTSYFLIMAALIKNFDPPVPAGQAR